MWNKIKEGFLIMLAHICLKQLQDKIEERHKEHLQEIANHINESIAEGVEITLMVAPELAELIHDDPSPKPNHLTVVDDDE